MTNTNASAWSFSQFEQYVPREYLERAVTHWLLTGAMIGAFVVSVMYTPVRKLLYRHSTVFRKNLSKKQQAVVVMHTIEAILLVLLFAPMTYLMLSVHFQQDQSFETFIDKVTAIASIQYTLTIMYLVELAVRHDHQRPLVVVHHLCTYGNAMFLAIYPTMANFRGASWLCYFITLEALTFVGLILYRLWPSHWLTRPMILTGMIVFGLSRPLQLLVILGGLYAIWDDFPPEEVWHAWIQVSLTIFFTMLQCYSLYIHYGLYRKCGRTLKQQQEQQSSNGDGDCDCHDYEDGGDSCSNDEDKSCFSKEKQAQQIVVDSLYRTSIIEV